MNVLRPATIDEALAMKAAQPELVPVAGGTDLWVNWPTNAPARERDYLDLSGVANLRHITTEDGELVLGAGATYRDLLACPTCRSEFPILAAAASQVGAVQIQARGTWAGNVANASPAADGVPALMACDASVTLASSKGERNVPLDGFFTGYRTSVARPDELIVELRMPRGSAEFERFEKVGARRAQTITKVGVALRLKHEAWRVVAISMAPTICRCPSVEALLARGDASAAEIEDAVAADLTPIDDMRSTARYRLRVFANLVRDLAGAAPA